MLGVVASHKGLCSIQSCVEFAGSPWFAWLAFSPGNGTFLHTKDVHLT